MQSRYVVFPEKEKIEIQTEEVTAPEPDEILGAATKSLISIGTEINCLRGIADPGTNWEEMLHYPVRPGYSMVGRVLAVGREVQGWKEGDRFTSRTPHSQFFRAKLADTHPIPDEIDDQDATWVRLAGTTQLGVRRAELRMGESVAVIGLGMLGQLVVQYAALSGARRVIAIDPVPNRLELAKQHGATHAIALDAKSARSVVADLTHGKMLDVVFDVTGHPAVLTQAVQLLRRFGRVVLLGDTPTPNQQFIGPGVVSNSISILGIHGTGHPAQSSDFSPWSREEMANLFFDYLVQGRMRVSDLITQHYSALEAPRVYDQLLRDRSKSVGVLLDWTTLKE
jgi:2-desacetyl-2-hydroxyethyl bacteriochlorophyllide A dehydrogenase